MVKPETCSIVLVATVILVLVLIRVQNYTNFGFYSVLVREIISVLVLVLVR